MSRLTRGPLPEKFNGQVAAQARDVLANIVDNAAEIFAVLAPIGGKPLSAFTNIYNAAFSLSHFVEVNSPLLFGEAAATANAASAAKPGARRGRPPKGGWPVETTPATGGEAPSTVPTATDSMPTAQEIHDARENGGNILDVDQGGEGGIPGNPEGGDADQGETAVDESGGSFLPTEDPPAPAFPTDDSQPAPGAGLSAATLARIDAAAETAPAPAAPTVRRGGRRAAQDAAPGMPG